ncbi:enoyl-CoA hydratase/isomerase family protein [Salicibibacter halophilus]|uniref:Enoyl-CoA hydratase/isomerase family protein n=1 Tax=Salicibibacter halophilus TaxID=2502791 RepID=A0A514LEN3_9BACI|nr:enoyl-CoA hydratase-related protein [Salicibibacter halophilus]QDI90312.1 enoyl-CoA hydratase/isomerase family protein [Salicibibacter halophilus]
MDFELIQLNVRDRWATVTINRPDVRNALNAQVLQEMEAALDDVDRRSDVDGVIFTGTGEKAFAAGADITQLRNKEALDALEPGMQDVYDKLAAFEKPTIAMINGVAAGGGCELALACDIRVASTKAKVGLPELNLGIIPGAGGTQRLTRLVGKGKAVEMILRGKLIVADEALRIGLVNDVAEPEALEEKVREITADISAKGPLAVRLAKMVVTRGADANLETAELLEKLAQAVAFQSEDKNEGTSAFLEKRQANFQGK